MFIKKLLTFTVLLLVYQLIILFSIHLALIRPLYSLYFETIIKLKQNKVNKKLKKKINK